MKSWRDVYKVHPAADLFPMLPEDELRKLGEDIKVNGQQEAIVLWSPDDAGEKFLLDGRNRLAAATLVGIDWDKYFYAHYVYGPDSVAGVDPYAYVISKNIRRRHLTKEQQADLIVKVMKASEAGLAKVANPVKNDLAKVARSFSPKPGKRGGSTKDSFKAKVVAEAEKHGISKRTAENAIAKERGPTIQSTPKNKEAYTPGTDAFKRRQWDRQVSVCPHCGENVTNKGYFNGPHAHGKCKSIPNWVKNGTTPKPASKAPTDRELVEKLNAALKNSHERIVSLQKQITEMMSGTFNFLARGGLDVEKIRRDMVKKYHPDRNSEKMFPASEVMADINRLCDEVQAAISKNQQ